jgi:hypothetical protein
MVPEIGEVDSVRDHPISESGGDWLEGGSEFLAAEIAPVWGVRNIPVVREFGDPYGAQAYADLRGLFRCLVELAPRQGLCIREDGQGLLRKRVVGDPRNQTAVDSAGKSDEHTSLLPHGLPHAVIRHPDVLGALGGRHRRRRTQERR